MLLLLTVFAAVSSTIVWYCSRRARKLKVGILCYMYWGAALMWFVDAVAEYLRIGAEAFHSPAEVLLNEAFLGLSVLAVALVVWTGVLLVTDPEDVRKEMFPKRGND